MEILQGKANYETWRIRMLTFMAAQEPNLWNFMKHPPPNPTIDANWLKLNYSAMSVIFFYVSDDILFALAKLENAHEIWTYLARKFGTKSNSTDQKKPRIEAITYWCCAGAEFYMRGAGYNDWFIDTTATHHMCFQKEWFDRSFPGEEEEEEEEEIGSVRILNGSLIPIKGQGNVAVVLENGRKMVMISDVLYVPHFKVNVISVSSLTGKGYWVSFDEGMCAISNGDQVFEAPRSGDFYKFSTSVL